MADDDSAATRAVGVGGILLTVVLRCGHAPAQGHAGVLGQGEGEGTPLPLEVAGSGPTPRDILEQEDDITFLRLQRSEVS